MIKINHDNAHESNNQGVMPEGDYEVVVKGIEEKQASTGTPYINVELVVRNDIDQSYKNKHLWYTIWSSKDTHEYNAKGIDTISKNVGIQNGATFNSYAEWGNFLKGKPLIASVKHDEYNGKTRERVSFLAKSKQPNCNHDFNGKGSAPSNTAGNTQNNTNKQPQRDAFINLAEDDDDLPF
jgi:hypothetical protein